MFLHLISQLAVNHGAQYLVMGSSYYLFATVFGNYFFNTEPCPSPYLLLQRVRESL